MVIIVPQKHFFSNNCVYSLHGWEKVCNFAGDFNHCETTSENVIIVL